MSLLTAALTGTITGFTRVLTGAQARWIGCAPAPVQRIYYGNHSSHADFVLIWASLPHDLLQITDGLVPELRARGLFRASYAGHSLRESLGLSRPANRYSTAATS